MQVVQEYPDGVFCWVDLATTDIAGAKAFYGGLFGWDFVDLPTDRGIPYTMFQIEGKNVAAAGPMMPDLAEQGVPSHWSSYVKHSDADAVAARVTEAGGTVMMPPMDVMDSGRMFFGQDPSGAAFGVWQPANHIGAELVNVPNTLVWNELQTRDKDGALAFYGSVFGWTHDSDPNGYVMYKADDRIQAGMIQMDESWGPVPPNWSVYFLVEDVDATVAKVSELGGNVLVPPVDAGEMGRFSVVQDPQGGAFTVMQFNGPVDPPPGY